MPRRPPRSPLYAQVYDGDWFEVRGVQHIACCDCSLVHDVYVRTIAGKVFMRMDRNTRRTAALRRKRTK